MLSGTTTQSLQRLNRESTKKCGRIVYMYVGCWAGFFISILLQKIYIEKLKINVQLQIEKAYHSQIFYRTYFKTPMELYIIIVHHLSTPPVQTRMVSFTVWVEVCMTNLLLKTSYGVLRMSRLKMIWPCHFVKLVLLRPQRITCFIVANLSHALTST